MSQTKCPICGAPTFVYFNARKDGLCAKHADMLKAGEIEQCEKCGKYHKTGERCAFCVHPPKIQYTQLPTEGFSQCVACGTRTSGYAFCRDCFHQYSEEDMLDILNGKRPLPIPTTPVTQEHTSEKSNDENESENEGEKHPLLRGKCLICGYDSGENYFCKKCYYKFKDKTILVKISKCQDIELTDESYESTIKCDDGHMVKSYQEQAIDNYLNAAGIHHAYESTLIIDDDGTPIQLSPDFYLPNYLGPGKHVWLEHWGIDEEQNQKYGRTKSYKLKMYRKHLLADPSFTLITSTEKDLKDIRAGLGKKLDKRFVIPGTIDGKKE